MPIIDVTVAASTDDAHELSDTTVNVGGNPLANCDTVGVWNGARWNGITIPAGALISAAWMTVQMTSSTLDEPDLTIYGHDVASPATFAATNTNLSARTRTTASVNWSNTNTNSNVDVNTSSLVTIIQELVDSYGPYSSGSIVLLWTTRAGTATRDTSVKSWNGSATLCPRLHIEYSAGGDQSVDKTDGVTLGEVRAANLGIGVAVVPEDLAYWKQGVKIG